VHISLLIYIAQIAAPSIKATTPEDIKIMYHAQRIEYVRH
jgi:hypothetical protein